METVKCPHCKKEIELSEVTEEHAKNLAAQKINDENSSSEVIENYIKFYNENYPELFTSKEKNRKLH